MIIPVNLFLDVLPFRLYFLLLIVVVKTHLKVNEVKLHYLAVWPLLGVVLEPL